MIEPFTINVGIEEQQKYVSEVQDNTVFASISYETQGPMIRFGCNVPEDKEKEYSIIFGKLLHRLTSGQLSLNIVSVLNDFIDIKPEYEQFIMDIIDTWTKSKVQDDDFSSLEEEPIIQPLRTFGASRFLREQ